MQRSFSGVDRLGMWNWIFVPLCLGCRAVAPPDDLPLCSRCAVEHAALPEDLARVGPIEAVYPYDGPLGRALGRLKYQGEHALARPLGRALGRARSATEVAWDDLVPVPMHWRRRLSRGGNHAAALCRAAAAAWPGRGARCSPNLLSRRRDRPSQASLPRHERQANLRATIAASPNVRGRRILVIDDVTTTGATLHACLRAATQAGAAAVGGLALLRTLA